VTRPSKIIERVKGHGGYKEVVLQQAKKGIMEAEEALLATFLCKVFDF
jgi:hypothetical protein